MGLRFVVGILEMNEVFCLSPEYDCDFPDDVVTLLTVCLAGGRFKSRWGHTQYGMKFFVIFLSFSMQVQA